MKKNGFTLVEMLVVLAIMALILIMVFPLVNNIQQRNENKKYVYHERAVLEAAKLYYDQHEIDLAGSSWTGCLEITYQQLLDSLLLKEIQEENTSCTGVVRVHKNQDQEQFKAYVTCTKGGKTVYQNSAPAESCTHTVQTNFNYVYDKLFDPSFLGENCSIQDAAPYQYLAGKCEANYLSYSDQQFRVYGRNQSTGVVYMILDGSLSKSAFGTTDTWQGSSIRTELQNFYNLLKESKTNLLEQTCLYDQSSYCTQYGKDYVGLLKKTIQNPIEGSTHSPYDLIGKEESYLNIGENYWMLKSASGLFAERNVLDPAEGSTTTALLGVRPVLTIKSEVRLIGGNGSKEHPYLID